MSMQDLAAAVGTSQQQIDRLEKGKRRLTVDWMDKISAALNCGITELLPSVYDNRDANTTKAKVVGKLKKNGGVEWFGDQEIYSILFGRPREMPSPRLFAIVVEDGQLGNYCKGDELVFCELDGEDKSPSVSRGKFVICANSKKTGDVSYKIFKAPIPKKASQIKAILVKSIVNC